jgi:SAM-dependent methyltransferase
VEPERYDGLARWYDDEIRSGPASGVSERAVRVLVDLLGPGPGLCLDLACGTGIAVPALEAAGWTVTGVDISADQLAVARERLAGSPAELVRGDAAALPFADGSFDAVACLLAHTDLDQPQAALREAARALAPGGRLALVGAHPCFVNPVAVRRADGSALELRPGYRREGWWRSAPGFGKGIRPRVGVHHLTLASLLNAIAGAGLRLERAEEPGEEDYPLLLALVACTAP